MAENTSAESTLRNLLSRKPKRTSSIHKERLRHQRNPGSFMVQSAPAQMSSVPTNSSKQVVQIWKDAFSFKTTKDTRSNKESHEEPMQVVHGTHAHLGGKEASEEALRDSQETRVTKNPGAVPHKEPQSELHPPYIDTTSGRSLANGGTSNKEECNENLTRDKSTVTDLDQMKKYDETDKEQVEVVLASEEYVETLKGLPPDEAMVMEMTQYIGELIRVIRKQKLKLDDVEKEMREQTQIFREQLRAKDDTIGHLQIRLNSNEVERENAERIQKLQEDLRARDEMIDRLRTKTTEAAANKATEIPGGPSLLRRPQSEIIKEWQGLHYEVRNFVMNLRDKGRWKLKSWTDSQGFQLEEITPNYRQLATDKKCGSALIEAAIWNTLVRLVFGDSASKGGMCWAGTYAGKVSKLSSALFQAIPPSDSENQKVFHQWKAVTTGLVSALGPPIWPDYHTVGIVEELEDLLEPFRSSLPGDPVHQSLQSLVRKAVALDKSFCGQSEWYCLRYLNPRFNVPFEQNKMEVVEGSKPSREVAFTVRPCLCQAGGRRGETYDQFLMLDRYAVWTQSSSGF